jgi:hypothetical protein
MVQVNGLQLPPLLLLPLLDELEGPDEQAPFRHTLPPPVQSWHSAPWTPHAVSRSPGVHWPLAQHPFVHCVEQDAGSSPFASSPELEPP